MATPHQMFYIYHIHGLLINSRIPGARGSNKGLSGGRAVPPHGLCRKQRAPAPRLVCNSAVEYRSGKAVGFMFAFREVAWSGRSRLRCRARRHSRWIQQGRAGSFVAYGRTLWFQVRLFFARSCHAAYSIAAQAAIAFRVLIPSRMAAGDTTAGVLLFTKGSTSKLISPGCTEPSSSV